MRPDTPSTSPSLRSNEMSLTTPGCETPRTRQGRAARSGARLPLGKELIDRPTDHQRHEPFDGEVGARTRADHLAVAQHHDVVAKPQDVAEDVADVDDRDPLPAQPIDDLEQPFGLARGQRRRRLVEDDEPRLPGQRLGDFDELTFALRQSHDRRGGRDVQVDRVRAPSSPALGGPAGR